MKPKVVIIGAGLAGITIGNELAKYFDVSIIESGPATGVNVPVNKFKNKDFGVAPTYCNAIGGTTNLWHNGLLDLDINNSDTSSKFSRALEKSKIFVNKAAKELFFTGNFFEEKGLRNEFYKIITSKLFNYTDVDSILIPNEKSPLAAATGVDMYSSVKDIKYSIKNDSNVTSISFTSGSKSYDLDCNHLIICGGGIGSPKLVTDLCRHINTSSDMIGVGLIDHPMGFIGKIRVNKELRSYFNQLVNYKVGDFTSRCGIVLRESGYSHICYIRPAVMMSNRLDIYKFKSKLANSTFKEKIRCLFDVRIFHPDILAEIYMYLTGKQISSSVFSLWVVFEQKYDADRSVTYDSGVTNINWFISDVEIENYKKSLVKLKKILSPAVRDIEIVESNLDDYLWSAAHHSGTVGIGTETGQVNEELLLNGFENVYVCDASIINEHSYSNTGLTIAQLSLDLCQRIINKSVNYL